MIALVGLAFIVATAIYWVFSEQAIFPVEIVYGASLIIIMMFFACLFVHFVTEAKKQASIDGKRLAERYKTITQERIYYRKLKKTFNRMLGYKMQRSIKQRNKAFLRVMNLVRLESLRLFSSEFSMATFDDIRQRIYEVALFSAENLARIHSDCLSLKNYSQSRDRVNSRNYFICEMFSTSIVLYLLTKIQN